MNSDRANAHPRTHEFIIFVAALFGFVLLMNAARADSIASTQPSTQAKSTQPAGRDFSDKVTGDWGGSRQKLADAGINVGVDMVLEGFGNLRGGVDTAHWVGATTFDLNFAFDMEKLTNIQGGEFYLDLEDHAFRNPTTALVGDLQVFDKDNNSPFMQFFEAWYQQKLLGNKLRIKVGKVDANTEFCVIDNGLLFLGSSSQVSPTIVAMPTTPDPMPSINVFFTPTDWYFASVGAYYSNQSDRFGDLADDPARFQLARYGSFLIGETGVQWQNAPLFNAPGNVKIGAWGHTGTFERIDGTPQQGTDGMYAVFDQTLFQSTRDKELGNGVKMFVDYGLTEADINPIDQHIGGGFTGTDNTPDTQSTIGVAAQYAHITRRTGLKYPYELSIEAFKQVQFKACPGQSFEPDVQYIIHPGGQWPDAVVVTLRWELDF